MLDASIAMMANYIPSVATLGRTVPRLGRGHAQIVPYQAFATADSRYVMVGAFTNGFWRRLCDALDHPEWKDDPRFMSNADRLAHRDDLMPMLEEIFRSRTSHEWLEILTDADVPNSPVLELHDAIASEQAVHNRIVQHLGPAELDVVKLPIESEQWQSAPATMPPLMGEHTDAILKDVLGMDEAAIHALASTGVVARRDADVEVAR